MSLRPPEAIEADDVEDSGVGFGDMAALLWGRRWLIILGSLMVGAAAVGASFLIAPTFTAVTTLIPPQPAQGGAAGALAASLGSLASLAGGGAASVRTPGDQYVSLVQSVTVSDRLIDAFDLMKVYEATFRVDAQRELARRVRVGLGKRDGLITIEVDDTSPKRAADMANRYVEELRRMTSIMAVSEAQQRRMFFEQLLKTARDKLALAQRALQGSGVNGNVLKAEPKAAAEGYAKLKAEVTTAEVRLQALRDSLTDSSPEVRQQTSMLGALRNRLAEAEKAGSSSENSDYVGAYREYKYQEVLFELYARQFEIARVDESREGALIQVIDPAQLPERKTKPKRAFIGIGATGAAIVLLSAWILLREVRRGGRGNQNRATDATT